MKVAERYSKKGVHFVDLDSAFARATKYAAPGQDLFLEHVHFNIDGHGLVAQTLSQSIVEKICSRTWNENRVSSDRERDQWLGLLIEDEIVACTLAGLLSQTPPFDLAVDLTRQKRILETRVENLAKSLPDDRREIFAQLNGKTRMDDMVDGIGRVYLERGDAKRALQFFELGNRRRPWMPNSLVFSAVSLEKLKRFEDARTAISQSAQTTLSATAPLAKVRNDLARRLR